MAPLLPTPMIVPSTSPTRPAALDSAKNNNDKPVQNEINAL